MMSANFIRSIIVAAISLEKGQAVTAPKVHRRMPTESFQKFVGLQKERGFWEQLFTPSHTLDDI